MSTLSDLIFIQLIQSANRANRNFITILSVCGTFRLVFVKLNQNHLNIFLYVKSICASSKFSKKFPKNNCGKLPFSIISAALFMKFFFGIREKQIILLCPFHRSRFTQSHRNWIFQMLTNRKNPVFSSVSLDHYDFISHQQRHGYDKLAELRRSR